MSAHRFLQWLCCEDGDRIVRVKSWRPSWTDKGIEWPCMLIDTRGGQRMTVWPVWDRVRLAQFWKRSAPIPPGKPTSS